MGFLIDSSVIIAAERGRLAREDLTARLGDETVALAAITASELLHGVHRAESSARRKRRAEFVEGLLASIPVLPFDLGVARAHAAVGGRGGLVDDGGKAVVLVIAHECMSPFLHTATRLGRGRGAAEEPRHRHPHLTAALWEAARAPRAQTARR